MDFTIRHEFAAEPPRLAATLLDRSFQDSLKDIVTLKSREVLSQETAPDGSVTRRVRCVLDIEITGVARTFIGDAEPAWAEVAVWDPRAFRWTWKIEPETAAELLSASGTTDIGPAAAGSARIVSGRVKVNVPLYGGKVERWIFQGIERAYNEEAERIAAWLEREFAS